LKLVFQLLKIEKYRSGLATNQCIGGIN